MKKNWKWSTMLSMVIIAALALSACGGKSGDSGNEAAGEKVNLTFTVWGM
ncbi:hypothetical protein [Paenibacillus glucanolyticus]|nr:hypothetical protein [Paenibacillus glucanolyticus]